MDASTVFWELAAELQAENPEVVEGTLMKGRCLRYRGDFLALVDYKDAGMVVKLPRARVEAWIASGEGRAFGPAGKIFREWASFPQVDRERWRTVLREAISSR